MNQENKLFDRVLQFCKQHSLFLPTNRIIIAYSGGVDSAFLLHVLNQLAPHQCVIAHLNHEWWPSDNNAEQLACSEAARYQIPFHGARFSDFSSIRSKGSREEHARRVRRAFFDEICLQYPTTVIAKGHHADDQIETLLLRLGRGTTVAGAAGIAPRSGNYIHPLLSLRKSEIIKAVDELQLPYVNDQANNDTNHMRVRLRASVIPALEEAEPRFIMRCLESMERFAHAERFINNQIHAMYQRLVVVGEHSQHTLLIEPFVKCEQFVRHRILMDWLIANDAPFDPQESFITELERFLLNNSVTAHHQITRFVTIYKERGSAWIIVRQM